MKYMKYMKASNNNQKQLPLNSLNFSGILNYRLFSVHWGKFIAPLDLANWVFVLSENIWSPEIFSVIVLLYLTWLHYAGNHRRFKMNYLSPYLFSRSLLCGWGKRKYNCYIQHLLSIYYVKGLLLIGIGKSAFNFKRML